MRISLMRRDVDMLEGSLIGNMALFAMPLMLTGVLQLLFNAADMIVVGRFDSSTALAAVGSTGSLIALFTNLFMGFSVGTGVVVARNYGAGDMRGVSKGVHTSIAVGAISGLTVGVIGLLFARNMLEWMGSPADVIDQAALYLRIYFIGMPFMMLYNFASAILRAVGDTQRPLYYLTVAGVANVLMNLLFVIVFRMGVAGVALATAISQAMSLALVMNCLLRTDRPIRYTPRMTAIDGPTLRELVRIGLPAGLQSTLFAISNVLIQSSVNSFGSVVMAANSAAANIESFAYTLNNAMHQAAVTFTSQNVGAKQYGRIPRITRVSLLMILIAGGLISGAALTFARPLLSLYTSDPQVVETGLIRMRVICLFIPACGMMDAMVGVLRGMGYSIMPMLVSLTGACLFRVVWILSVFRWSHSLTVLYASYPISWVLTFGVHMICFLVCMRKPQWRQRQEEIEARE